MRFPINYTLCLTLTFILSNATCQIVEWNKGASGSSISDSYFTDVETDKYGDIYLTGNFFWSFKYDGKIDTSHIQKNKNMFVGKLDPQGNFIWRFDGGGSTYLNDPVGIDIVVDSSGFIYLLGSFDDTLYLENNPPLVSNKVGQPSGTFFLAKFNNNGQLLKIIEHDSSGFYGVYEFWDDMVYAKIKMDNNGRLHFFTKNKEVVFDSDLNFISQKVFPISFEGFDIDQQNNNIYFAYNDTIVKKLNSSGNLIWSLNGAFGHRAPVSIIDSLNNTYILGLYFGTIIIGTDTLFAKGGGGTNSYFIYKLNSSGGLVWSKSIDIPGAYGHRSLKEIELIKNDILVVQGEANDSLYYDNLKVDGLSLFILGINPNDGSLLWKIFNNQIKNHAPRGIETFENIIYSCGVTDGSSLNLQGQVATGASYLAKILSEDNLISGKVFFDFNKNGVFDANDQLAKDILIDIPSISNVVRTDANGNYSIYVGNGSFTFSPVSAPNYYTSVPISHTVSFNSNPSRDTANDFALQPENIVNDVRIHFTPINVARPGFGVGYNLNLKNIGTTVMSGHVNLKFDPKLTYLSSNASPDTVQANSISWKYTSLNQFQERSINVYFRLDSTTILSDSVVNYAVAYPMDLDSSVWNNYDSSFQIVVGSYDPNDKRVFPDTKLNTFKYSNGDKKLEYQIRFQNTGTDTAFTVRIIDTLSALLDISTFEMMAASHSFEWELKNENVIVWTFRNINLPDSNTNEMLSHGFVKFRINPSTSISHGNVIENKAYIFFDFNTAIITNETSNEVSDWAEVTELRGTSNILIYPNPAKNEFVVESANELMINAIYSIEGKNVTDNFKIAKRGNQVNVQAVIKMPGIYILEIDRKGSIIKEKIVLSE